MKRFLALLTLASIRAGESVQRAFLPVPIRFDEAIAVAVIGILVNVICSLLLKNGHKDRLWRQLAPGRLREE